MFHIVNHGDDSGGSPNTWTMMTYVSQTPTTSTKLDLRLVLADVVSRGFALPSDAVGGVELIKEIFGGQGTLWLKSFDVKVTPK